MKLSTLKDIIETCEEVGVDPCEEVVLLVGSDIYQITGFRLGVLLNSDGDLMTPTPYLTIEPA